MARTEIAVAISEVENSRDYDGVNSRRVLFVAAAAMKIHYRVLGR